VSDAIINSEVSAGDSIEVTTGRATIVGGRMVARNRVQAQTIGNYSNSLITVILGDTLENLAERQEIVQKRMALIRELTEAEKSLKHLTQRLNQSASDQKKAEDLKRAIPLMKENFREVDNRLDMMERNQPPKTGCYLRASIVHPPLELTISGIRANIQTEAHGVRMVLRAGEVVQMPY